MAANQLTSGSSALQLARRQDANLSTQVSMSEWQVIREQAATLVTTGFLPQAIKTPEQALAIILTGRELGIGPMAALGNIHVIQGKPTVSPQLMLALINRTGELESIKLENYETGAICTMKRRGQEAYTARFGPKEAAAMGLAGKENYKKQPATMYKWRAVADAARSVFADAILGLYTPDELGAAIDTETGEVIHAPEPVAPQVVAPPVDGTDAAGLVEASTNEQRGRALIPYVQKYADGSGYGVTDANQENVTFSVFKGVDGKAQCSCDSTSAFCAHKWAVKLWNAQPAPEPPPQDEPDAIDAEPVDAPQFDDEKHQQAFDAQAPAKDTPFTDADWQFSKAVRINIFGFCQGLEKRGISEQEWRDKMFKMVGVRSRKELTSETAAKIEHVFAAWVEAIDAKAQRQTQKKGTK